MNPALSVIFFTTLSGAGFGALALAGLRAALRPDAPVGTTVALLVLGLALATTGLLSSTFHLGKPMRAWRAFSQWRTSWLSREGAVAMITYLPALAMLALSATQARHGWTMAVLGALLAVGAIATVACTAMIYASLKPVPAWRHGLVVPAYLLFALQTGLALAAAVAAFANPAAVVPALAGVAACGLVLAAMKAKYWRDIDAGVPMRRGTAVGLPDRDIRVFERPHTESNYITREMGFVLARRHGRRLRAIALVLSGALPVLAAAVAWLAPTALAMATLALLATLAGAFVERWLFFAQARHAVMAYY